MIHRPPPLPADTSQVGYTPPADASIQLAVSFLQVVYTALKTEQLGRMATRDNLVYATLATIGAVGYAAAQTGQTLFLLAIPFATAVLGWTRVANDSKVEAIRVYLRTAMNPHLETLVGTTKVLGWESGATGGRRGKYFHLVADLLLFVGSSAAAIAYAAPMLIAHLGLYSGPVIVLLAAFPDALGWEIVRNVR